MIKLILLLGLFVVVNSSCELKCDCPQFEALEWGRNASEPLPPADCDPTILCAERAYFEGNWSESELPRPGDANLKGDMWSYYYSNETIDLVDSFGIICANGLWYATKYPAEVLYEFSPDGEVAGFDVPKRDDGGYYKTKINHYSCGQFLN